jgi:hypothetical protein
VRAVDSLILSPAALSSRAAPLPEAASKARFCRSHIAAAPRQRLWILRSRKSTGAGQGKNGASVYFEGTEIGQRIDPRPVSGSYGHWGTPDLP